MEVLIEYFAKGLMTMLMIAAAVNTQGIAIINIEIKPFAKNSINKSIFLP